MIEKMPNSDVEPVETRDRRRLAVLLVSLVLFVAALTIPLYLLYRDQDTLTPTLRDIPNALTLPIKHFIMGRDYSDTRVKMAIALLALLALAAGRAMPARWKIPQWSVTILLTLLTFWAFRSESRDQLKALWRGEYIQYWNVYHYYFGTKYFKELGYHYQYAYTFKAADEGALDLKMVRSANDLLDYKIKPRRVIRAQVDERTDFTPERWELFKKELAVFDDFVPPIQRDNWSDEQYRKIRNRKSSWPRMLSDHGANGTPLGNVVGAWLAGVFPISKEKSRAFLLSFDMFWMLLAGLAVGWAFGIRWWVVFCLYYLLFYGNNGFTVGGFFRYDWLFTTVIAFAFFKKKHYLAAAPFLAYATMVRVFPVLLLVGVGLQWLAERVATKKMEWRIPAMGAVFALSCLVFFGIGCLSGRGAGAWKEFYDNIRYHGETSYYYPMRLGLKHLFTDDLTTSSFGDRNTKVNFEKQKLAFQILQIVMLVAFALVVLQRNRADAFAFGLMFVFAMLVLSRYYWAMTALLPLLAMNDQTRWRNIMGDILLFAAIFFFYSYMIHSEGRTTRFLIPNWYLLTYFLFMAGSWLMEDALKLPRRRKKQPATGPETAGA